MKLGKLMQTRRIEKGLAQAQPANKIGAGDRAVSKREDGRGLPDHGYIQSLCDELDIAFNEFIGGEKAEENNEAGPEENPASSCKESGESSRRLSAIKGILLIIGMIIILPVSMSAVDAHQTGSGKPAVFSSWGLKHYPSVDMHELELEKAIKDFVYEEREGQIARREPADAKGICGIGRIPYRDQ